MNLNALVCCVLFASPAGLGFYSGTEECGDGDPCSFAREQTPGFSPMIFIKGKIVAHAVMGGRESIQLRNPNPRKGEHDFVSLEFRPWSIRYAEKLRLGEDVVVVGFYNKDVLLGGKILKSARIIMLTTDIFRVVRELFTKRYSVDD